MPGQPCHPLEGPSALCTHISSESLSTRGSLAKIFCSLSPEKKFYVQEFKGKEGKTHQWPHMPLGWPSSAVERSLLPRPTSEVLCTQLQPHLLPQITKHGQLTPQGVRGIYNHRNTLFPKSNALQLALHYNPTAATKASEMTSSEVILSEQY